MQKRKGKEMEMEGRSEQGAVAARPWAEEGEEEKEQAAPAPSGVGGTAEEDEVRVKSRRRIRGRKPKGPKPDPVAKDSAPPPELPVDTNQDIPGSGNNKGGPMGGVEDGQRQQEEADRLWEEPRIFKLKESWLAENDIVREANQKLHKTLEDRDKEIRELKEELRLRDDACRQDERIIHKMEAQLSDSAKEIADSRAEAQTEKQRVTISQGVIEQLKQEVVSVTSKLADTTHDKHQLEADKDEAEVVINGLHERVDALENEVTSHDAVATENTSLQGQIAEVHTSLEDAFSDMAKGLTIEEKFTYVREHQAAAPTGRPRVVSGASLHEESDNLSQTGSQNDEPAPRQTLTFAGISSVETAPIAVVKSTAPFQYVDIVSVDTVPVSAPAALSIAAKKPTASLGFSDIATVETAPLIAPAATPATAPLELELITPATRARLLELSNTTLEAAPVVATPAAPAPRVILKTQRVYIETPVDRTFVPWWMWVLFLLGIFACIGGFAGLLREKQIWLDANDLAYERLMGGQQETWIEWIGWGVGDLLPDMGSGMMGHSMFA